MTGLSCYTCGGLSENVRKIEDCKGAFRIEQCQEHETCVVFKRLYKKGSGNYYAISAILALLYVCCVIETQQANIQKYHHLFFVSTESLRGCYPRNQTLPGLGGSLIPPKTKCRFLPRRRSPVKVSLLCITFTF